MRPDLDGAQAVARLEDYGIKCALEEGHVRQALVMVENSGARWKRDEGGNDPDDILDAAALLSHYVSLNPRETTPVISESVMQAKQTYGGVKRHPSFTAAERILLAYDGELTGGIG